MANTDATSRKLSGPPIPDSSSSAPPVPAAIPPGTGRPISTTEAKNVFKELDDFTGPVIKRDFILTPPEKVEVTVQGTPADPTDIVTGHAVRKVLSAL